AQPVATTATATARADARRMARRVRVGDFECKGGLSRLVRRVAPDSPRAPRRTFVLDDMQPSAPGGVMMPGTLPRGRDALRIRDTRPPCSGHQRVECQIDPAREPSRAGTGAPRPGARIRGTTSTRRTV